ncbi:MAG: N-acetyltransferase [Anaerolineales bacterium]|nr:MAG: N-acetyltransferase [Anaerolineales bacterium]
MKITLQPVTAANWRELIKLKVRDDQAHFVASNVHSIAESQFGFEDEGHWNISPFGIYADNEAVGFLMYATNLGHSRIQVFIQRLMVDEKFQGKGYGRQAMQVMLGTIRGEERIRNVAISYEPDNRSAKSLYASLGFKETGEMAGDELLAVLNLR